MVGVSHKTNDQSQITNQLSKLAVVETTSREAHESESSSSSESSDDGEVKDVLARAGVEGLDLETIKIGPDGKAPLELMSQVHECSGI